MTVNSRYRPWPNSGIHDELIHDFPNSAKVTGNFSQAYQDLFVLTMLRGKLNGRYLEIGSNEPQLLSNTALLESLGWKGISIEILPEMVEKFNAQRLNPCYEADATTFDWKEAVKQQRWRSNRFDYASIDCEPAETTYKALVNLPEEYRFSVITYETDVYKDGPIPREKQRAYLTERGYQLVASNVCNGSNPYEDWWVDPEIVPEEVWLPFHTNEAEARHLFIKNA